MKIAIEGCAHGELEIIYDCLSTLQEREGYSIDLLICCGDFQSVRNKDDLKAMAVPEKYQKMCTFYKYYNEEKRAPVLTLFIGGNHEASNYLQELPYGGWVAPNIYYMGRAGIVQFGNLRIGGLSGIFKGRDYLQGLWESPPYNQNSLRSVYHIRALDSFRLSQVKEKVHVMLSHDWPRGITEYGDRDNLLKRKPFLRDDIESNQLGSAPCEKLLHELKPDYWFAAHLHCKFSALITHDEGSETKFLALDKCLPKRQHLQILDLPAEYDGDKTLKYDAEWLAVLQNTNQLLTVRNVDCHMPGPGGNERYDFTPTPEEKKKIETTMGDMTIKLDSFVRTAPVYNPHSPKGISREPILNPQTAQLCEKLGIDDPLQVLLARTGKVLNASVVSEVVTSSTVTTPMRTSKLFLPAPVTPSSLNVTVGSINQDEISISDFNDTVDTETQDEISISDNNDTGLSKKAAVNVTVDTITQDEISISDTNDTVLTDNTRDTNDTVLSDTTLDTSACLTPVLLSVGKKTFKRRNQALYNHDDLDDSQGSLNEISCVEGSSPSKIASKDFT